MRKKETHHLEELPYATQNSATAVRRKYKKLIFSLVAILCLVLISCGNEKTSIKEIKHSKPILSFGNQVNQHYSDNIFIEDKRAVYVTGSATAENKNIVKLDIDDINNQEIIYKVAAGTISSVSVLDDWVYFILEEEAKEDHNWRLCRIKKGGSEKTELLNKIYAYVLTEDRIYYEQGIMGEVSSIGVMDHDGRNKREILKGNHTLVGIDNEWIYYYKNQDEESYLYRVKTDGRGSETAFNINHTSDDEMMIDNLVIESDLAFFTYYNHANSEKGFLAEKRLNKKETILSKGSLFTSLNKEGDWIFYGDLNSVYKINVNEKVKAQRLYRFEEEDEDGIVRSIFLHNGDALVTSQGNKSVYIKQDGTIIELGVISQKNE